MDFIEMSSQLCHNLIKETFNKGGVKMEEAFQNWLIKNNLDKNIEPLVYDDRKIYSTLMPPLSLRGQGQIRGTGRNEGDDGGRRGVNHFFPGTGKTFLAVAAAVDALERNEVRRIILTRPAVEAGEKLGFLPGDLSQKVDPYLRPLYDALFEMLGFEKVEKFIERQIIEIAPLAYMRGRTLNDSFIILDEAQNTTIEQMKMFLTRIGFNSKAVITGDPSQIDLPRHIKSGLKHAIEVLKDVDSIGFSFFESGDVVRHPVVAAIVNAYELYDKKEEERKNAYRELKDKERNEPTADNGNLTITK